MGLHTQLRTVESCDINLGTVTCAFVAVLTLGTSECDFRWNGAIANVRCQEEVLVQGQPGPNGAGVLIGRQRSQAKWQ